MAYEREDFEEVTCSELVFMGRTGNGNLRIFVPYDDPTRDIVIPKSEVKGTDFDKHTPPGTEGYLELPRWLAENESLSYDEP